MWKKTENKKHQSKIEHLLQMEDIMNISTPRPGAKRGGGAAIVADLTKYSLKKLNIPIPKSVEVVWGLLQSKSTTPPHIKILVMSFYSPPNSKKITDLLDHMTTNLHHLRAVHPTAGVIIGGDRNNISIERLFAIDPSLKQIVNSPTLNLKILDVILTNIPNLYQLPMVVPPVPVDIPGHGVPSDHKGVVVDPLRNTDTNRKFPRTTKLVRPSPQSSMPGFHKDIAEQSWSFLDDEPSSPTTMVERFVAYSQVLLDKHFPTKSVSVSIVDKPWFTEELRKLKRKRQRIYTKEGKSAKWTTTMEEFVTEQKKAVEKFKGKIDSDVLEGNRCSSYSALRILGVRDSEANSFGHFDLPDHQENNLTSQQSAEKIATYFSAISQEYSPLDISSLPPNVRECLSSAAFNCDVPILEEHEVFQKIQKSKKPSSCVPGDLPVKLVKEFDVELAKPVSKIFNRITSTLQYPKQWKVEHQIPIPKKHPPQDEGDLQNIAKTAFFSKNYESMYATGSFPT